MTNVLVPETDAEALREKFHELELQVAHSPADSSHAREAITSISQAE
jgi:hypothetical protein